MSKGLIIVDVQNDYFQGGRMELVEMDKAAGNCRWLLHRFREEDLPVFHIRHISNREGATFFLPDTPGSEIHDSVLPREGEAVVTKHFPNAFRETELNGMLQESGLSELVVCGAMTHMCVDTTVRAAFDLGYRCTVVDDACATRDLEFGGQAVPAAQVQAAFMASLKVPFARVIDARELLDS